MSLLGRIFKSSDRGGSSSSRSDTRDIGRHGSGIEAREAPQQKGEQVKHDDDADRELERWAAEDDKDVKRR